MTRSSFKALLLMGLLLPQMAFAQQKLTVPTNAEVVNSIDHAMRHYHTARAYYVQGIAPLDYRAYRERMAQILEWVGEQEKRLNAQHYPDRERHTTLGRYIQEEDARIKVKEARYQELAVGKGKKGSLEMQLIGESLLDLNRRYIQHVNEVGKLTPKIAEYNRQLDDMSRLKAALEPLTKNEGARPTVERVALALGDNRLFESQLKLNEEAIRAMRQSIENNKQIIADMAPELQRIHAIHTEIHAQHQALMEAADAAQQNFKLKLQEMDEHIDSEIGKRFLGNCLLDVMEVAIDAKGNPWAALAGLGNKVLEAYIFNDGGKKNWQMYDPSLLVGDYQEKGKYIEAHWNDGAATSSPYISQVGRSLLALPFDALSNLGGLDMKRREIIARFGRETRDMLVTQAKHLDYKKTLDLMDHMQMNELVRHELRSFSGEAMSAAQQTAANSYRNRLAKAMAELATKIRFNNEAIEVAGRAARTASERIETFTARRFMANNASKAVKGKTLAGNVASGIAWDAVRQAWQSLMDRDAERVWIDFLDTEVKTRATIQNLANINLARFSIDNSLALYEHLTQIYLMLNAETERMIQEYSAATLGEDGMYVLVRSATSEEVARPTLKIITRGEVQGMTVYLKGDKGDIEFTPLKPFDTYRSLSMDVVRREIEGVDETREWEFRLGRQPEVVKKKLSEISSDGRLLISVRFY